MSDATPSPQAELPTREELNAELLELPDPPDQPPRVDPPGLEQVLATALSYVRGKRGGDLVAVILVGSGARRALTAHSDLDLIALVKGQDEGQETIRITDRYVEVRYRGQKAVEEELPYSLRLPPLLRKGRVLFELDAAATTLLDKAQQRFRQGPPPAGIHERIRMKADCVHWLGKAEDVARDQAAAQYLLALFTEDLMQAFFRLRGFWLTAPADMLRFIASRDAEWGALVGGFMVAPNLSEKLALGRQAALLLFKDVPNPQRID